VSGNQAFSWIGGATFTAAEFEIQLVGSPALVVGGTGTDNPSVRRSIPGEAFLSGGLLL